MRRMEKMLDLYRDLCRIPNISEAWINRTSSAEFINVTSIWSQIDLNRNERTKFERHYVIDYKANSIKPNIVHHSNPVEITDSVRSLSKTGAYTAVIREVVPNKKSNSTKNNNEKTEYIDVFSNTLYFKENSVDLKAQEKHGKVHTSFCPPRFSHGEGHLLYVAEKYRKPVGLFDPKFDEEKYRLDPNADEFIFTESWGERLSEVKEPVVCILDINSDNVSVLDDIPNDISPFQPVWGPNDEGIIFIGLSNSPAKLGLGACLNRRSRLYYYDIKGASCQPITDSDTAIKLIRFSNDCSKFAFVESTCGGAHQKGEVLKTFDWNTKRIETAVDIVDSPADSKSFPGLYGVELPERCWAQDNKRVLLTTIWRSKTEIVVVNTETGAITCLTDKGEKYGSWKLLDVFEDAVLAVNSAPNRPHGLFLARLPASGKEEPDVVWSKLDREMPRPFEQLLSDVYWNVLTLRRPNMPDEPEEFSEMQYEAILQMPAAKKDAHLPPLIAIPHGGPHGTSVATWLSNVAFFVLSGYAVLRINYRGSLGFGENFVKTLPGRVGSTDILDCKHAIDACLDNMTGVTNQNQPRQIFLYGGSHGGFIACHLIGQFPGYAQAAVAVNPVINIASMHFESDIPDWAVYETFGTEYDEVNPLKGDELAVMLQKSPVYYVDKVVTPLMLTIGENDQRVPCAQIKQYARLLQGLKVPLKILSYPSNDHSVGKVDAEANLLINTLQWFENYQHSKHNE